MGIFSTNENQYESFKLSLYPVISLEQSVDAKSVSSQASGTWYGSGIVAFMAPSNI